MLAYSDFRYLSCTTLRNSSTLGLTIFMPLLLNCPSAATCSSSVLSNDTDPAGGILVVQSVSAVPGSGVAAAVLGHETVRISDIRLSEQAGARRIHDLQRVAHGRGRDRRDPGAAARKLRPPVANDDQAVVRVGDTVTIPVLANDYHPNGDTMHVAPDLVPPLVDPADGEAFVSEDKVRFRAGNTPKTVYVTYEAVDSTGQRDAGYVTIQILPRNDEANSAPKPRDLTARTLSGSTVTIPVPLDGIDQDGDSVELVGIADARRRGASSRPARTRSATRPSATPRASTGSPTGCATASARTPRPPCRSESHPRHP